MLPLKNLSAEPDSEYFVDGLTDEIIRNLAVIKGLEVRSRTSSFAFKDKPRNLRDVGEQLGVNLVVEGSIMRSGSRLRINAQLVQIAGDVPLWAERYDRELKDVFAIQDEISRAIVNKLRLTLGSGQRRYDTNLEAYELYLKARVLVGRGGSFAAQQAVKLFEQAIARDPSFAPAYAGLADAYAAASTEIPDPLRPTVIPPETALAFMRPAAETALQLDPLLAEAHAAMGLLHSRERDWQKAEESFRRAIDLNPSLTAIYTNYSSSTLLPLGKLDEAERLLRAALQTDPLSLEVRRGMGVAADHRRAVRGGDRQPRARANGRPRLPICRPASRESSDVCRQAGGGVTPVGDRGKNSRGGSFGWPTLMSWPVGAQTWKGWPRRITILIAWRSFTQPWGTRIARSRRWTGRPTSCRIVWRTLSGIRKWRLYAMIRALRLFSGSLASRRESPLLPHPDPPEARRRDAERPQGRTFRTTSSYSAADCR